MKHQMKSDAALLITLAVILSKCFATSFISDVIPSQISSSSNLVVRRRHTECDHK